MQSLSCWVERPRTALKLPLLVCVAGFHSIGDNRGWNPEVRQYAVGLNFLIMVSGAPRASRPQSTLPVEMPSFGRTRPLAARDLAAGNSTNLMSDSGACYRARRMWRARHIASRANGPISFACPGILLVGLRHPGGVPRTI